MKTRGKKKTLLPPVCFNRGDPSHTKKTLRMRERERGTEGEKETGHIELNGDSVLTSL